MKKIGLLLLFSLLLAGCNSNKEPDSSADSTTENSTSSAISSTEESSSTVESSTPPESSTSSETTPAETPETSEPLQSNAPQTNQAPTPSAPAPVDPLAGYSDLQIEYARVWLAVMGNSYKEDPNGFELHVYNYPAGHPVNIYDEGSVTYPVNTVALTGKFGYQSLVWYSSNHNGTITNYPAPSHWQLSQEQASNPEYIRQITQKVLDDAYTVEIPVGDPNEVKELIDVMIIDS